MINNTSSLDDFEVPTPELRKMIREIAQEDGVTFAAAMATYDTLRKWARTEHRAIQNSVRVTAHEHSLTHEEVRLLMDEAEDEVTKRVVRMRKTLNISFANAVRNYTMTDYHGDAPVKPVTVKHRKCTQPKCKRPTADDSYYRCAIHREDNGSDEGDLVYMVPPPHGFSLQVRNTSKKLAAAEEAQDE